MKFFASFSFLAAAVVFSPAANASAQAGDVPGNIPERFEERIRSVVAVEFFVETEIDRRPAAELGLVADDEGLILVPEHAIPGWVPIEKLKEFKVSPLRTRSKFEADYLGQENVNGWHFLRVVDEAFYELATPVTAYGTEEPRMGQELWGIAVMDDDFDFEPYFLSSRFSLLRDLPQDIGFTTTEVTSPGSLVFSFEGALVGWGSISYLTESVLHIGEERVPVSIQGRRESGTFIPVAEFLPYLDRVPESPHERNGAWVGISSLQPIERDVAEFLGLTERAGVILGEIIEKSPAAEADLVEGDVVLAVDGDPVPSYRPHRAVIDHLQREILKRAPGDTLRLTLLRGTEEIEREVEVGVQPKTLREAKQEYFSKIGFTVREFLVFDGVARRVGPETDRGLIVQFVRPNSPADGAGLSTGDWIQEVDGIAISSFDEAAELIAEAENEERRETVFLISRDNETSVIRVRLQ